MKMRWLGGIVLGLGLMGSVCGAQEQGSWRAVSSTSRSITGDVAFSGEKIYINFERYTIAEIRALTPAESVVLFGDENGGTGQGKLFRVSIPADKKFLKKNTLCGTDETQWIATFVAGKTLQLVFFSGSAIPVLTADGVANSGTLCGTYSYAR